LNQRQEAEEDRLKRKEEAAEAKRKRELERSRKDEEVKAAELPPASKRNEDESKGDTDTLPASPLTDKSSE
jgi:hypothetical protein